MDWRTAYRGREGPTHRRAEARRRKNDRALNRRVEIFLYKGKKRKTPKRCNLADALKTIDLTDRPRLQCLRNILIRDLRGHEVDDRFWIFIGSDIHGTTTNCERYLIPPAHKGQKFIRRKPRRWHHVPASFLDRHERPLRIVREFKKEAGTSCDPKTIEDILIWLERTMRCNILMLGEYLRLNCEVGRSGFTKDVNCAFARLAYDLATRKSPASVYACFKSELKEYITTCAEGCAR